MGLEADSEIMSAFDAFLHEVISKLGKSLDPQISQIASIFLEADNSKLFDTSSIVRANSSLRGIIITAFVETFKLYLDQLTAILRIDSEITVKLLLELVLDNTDSLDQVDADFIDQFLRIPPLLAAELNGIGDSRALNFVKETLNYVSTVCITKMYAGNS